MEEELKAILLRSIRKPKNLIEYIPLYTEQTFKSQLLIVSNKIKKYGNGYLQNRDLVYYYRTFRFQDSKISIFCVIYFHFSLKRKYIEQLADEIYELTDINNIIENNNFNNDLITKINELFYKYQTKIKEDKGVIDFISGIELIRNTPDEKDTHALKDLNSTNGIVHRKNIKFKRKESNNKTNSELGSTFSKMPYIDELNFMMRGYNLNKIIKIMKWKKTKKCWLIIFIIISVLLYALLGFYIFCLL